MNTMSLPSVFLSYNPHSDLEKTLAVRLHTIGGINGLQVNLPDRLSYQFTSLTDETKHRIRNSNYFILFSTSLLSPIVLEEIEFAFSKYMDRSKIIVIYDKRVGSNLPLVKNCTEIYIDPSGDLSSIVTEITGKIKSLHSKKSESSPGLGALILAGLGLFALASMFEEDEPRRRKPAYKKPKKKKSPPKKKRTS